MKLGEDKHQSIINTSKKYLNESSIIIDNVHWKSKLVTNLTGFSVLICAIYIFPGFTANTTPYNHTENAILILYGILMLAVTASFGVYIESLFKEDVSYSQEELIVKYISTYLIIFPFVILFLCIVTFLSGTNPNFVNHCLFLIYSTPLIGFTIQILFLKIDQFRRTNDKEFFKGINIIIIALVISLIMTFITTYPKSIVSGVKAGTIVPIGWLIVIFLFIIGGLFNIRICIKKTIRTPVIFILIVILTFIISFFSISYTTEVMGETSLKIDKSNYKYEKSYEYENEYNNVEVTVVNEGGKPASGNISIAVSGGNYDNAPLTHIAETNRIDGFGKWHVSFHFDSTDGITIILIFNNEKKDELVIYNGCADIIPISFAVVTAAIMKRRTNLRLNIIESE
jgi:hypothetical protein